MKKYHNILGWLIVAAFAIINAFQTIAPWWFGVFYFVSGAAFVFFVVYIGGGQGEEKAKSSGPVSAGGGPGEEKRPDSEEDNP